MEEDEQGREAGSDEGRWRQRRSSAWASETGGGSTDLDQCEEERDSLRSDPLLRCAFRSAGNPHNRPSPVSAPPDGRHCS